MIALRFLQLRAGIIAALGLTLEPTALAQQPAEPSLPKFARPGDDPFSGISTDLDISTEENKAKTSFGVAGYLTTGRIGQAETTRRYDTSWKLGLAIPIGGKSDILDKGTLDNLGDGTKLSASITLLSFTSNPTATDNPAFEALVDIAKRECERKAETETTKETCRQLEYREEHVRTYTPWLEPQMNRTLYKGFWTLGGEGAISTARYKFIESPGLAERKQRKLGYSGKISFNYYPADAFSKIRAELEFSDAPESGKSTIICKAVVTVPANDCKTGAAKAPERKTALIFRSGIARFIPFRNGKQGIGLEITGSKDALSKDWAIEAPVYITIPGVSQISPGVKASYGSKSGEKDFNANFFVKTAFSF